VNKQRINYLLQKYIDGTINDVEKQELFDLYNTISSRNAEYPDDKGSVNERILQRLNNEIQHKTHKHTYAKLWKIAAAVVTVSICVTLYMLNRPDVKPTNTIAKQKLVKQAIVPGTDVAVLTLGNGKKILLNASAKGQLAVLGNTVITKNAAGQISYHIKNNAADAYTPITYNTIETPTGGQFKITLPDGSDVWLNAASSLTYPSRFEGNERHVELHGEAYFEIAKNKNAPFTVKAESVNIKVLGTHFNVMAYKDEPSIKTTLLEGSVSLSSNKAHKFLVPGEQAVTSATADNITINKVNVEDAIAWKNGYFSFRKENINAAMNKIARWYNVSIEYRGPISNKTLGGSVARTEDINVLLDYLELTGIAKFDIEGRRIIVICK
jgi:transmembrane sensor